MSRGRVLTRPRDIITLTKF